jgi:anti-sigma B factor antagonist
MTQPGSELTWTVEPGDHATVVHLDGVIDLATQQIFDEAVRAGLRGSSAITILNLDKVTFLASVGLRVLVQAHQDTQDSGRAVRVVDGAAIVHRIMEISGLEQVLALYPTVTEAQVV